MADSASPGNTSPVNLPNEGIVCPWRKMGNEESIPTSLLLPGVLGRFILS